MGAGMRVAVDFHHVPEHQAQIHGRLLNWAAWCAGRSGSAVSPMFRSYRSTDVWAAPEAGNPVDGIDAATIAKAVIALPENHRHATNWSYVRPVAPARACRSLGVTMEDLAQLVIDARQFLINRRA